MLTSEVPAMSLSRPVYRRERTLRLAVPIVRRWPQADIQTFKLVVLFVEFSEQSLKPWVIAQGIEIVVMLDPILHGTGLDHG